MPQVKAQIVVAQAGSTPPAGYTHGSRDRLALETLITCTNLSNAGVEQHIWEVIPLPMHEGADFGVTGATSPTLGLTVSAERPGDVAVRLTVIGKPDAPGKPNRATATVLLGLRAPLSGYAGGVPILHPFESELGGEVTFSPRFGFVARIVEMLWALYLRVLSGGGGGGGPVELVGDVNGTSDDNTVVGLLDHPLGPAVNTPGLGQGIVYTTANGGQYTLSPAPSGAGQLHYWDTQGPVGAWANTFAPTNPGDAPRWDGSTWLMGPIDAAKVSGLTVNGTAWAEPSPGQLPAVSDDGLLTLTPAPAREGQGPRWDANVSAYRQVGGEVTVDLGDAVGGVLVLSDDQANAETIILTGLASTSDCVVRVPVRPGRRWVVSHNGVGGAKTTGLMAVDGGTRVHILPGEVRHIEQVDQELRGDDDALVLRYARSYLTGSTSASNVALCTLPGGYEITSLVESAGAVTGGTIKSQMGTGSGGIDLLPDSTAHSAALTRGRKVSELGSAFQLGGEEGLSYSATARTIWHQLTSSTGATTGALTVYIYARRLTP